MQLHVTVSSWTQQKVESGLDSVEREASADATESSALPYGSCYTDGAKKRARPRSWGCGRTKNDSRFDDTTRTNATKQNEMKKNNNNYIYLSNAEDMPKE